MYRFQHRQLKEYGLRPRTKDEIETVANQFQAMNFPMSKALVDTLFMEAKWVNAPDVIYVDPALIAGLIKLGKETDDIYPSIPLTAVLQIKNTGLLYDIQDDRLQISQYRRDGRYLYEYRPDSDNISMLGAAAQECIRLICGLSIYLSNFPEQQRKGAPTRHLAKQNNILKHQKNTYVGEYKDAATGTFIRKPHFRTLGHDRFSRNEDGSPKIILIPQAEVKLVKEQKVSHVN